jgi:hypothetical protein
MKYGVERGAYKNKKEVDKALLCVTSCYCDLKTFSFCFLDPIFLTANHKTTATSCQQQNSKSRDINDNEAIGGRGIVVSRISKPDNQACCARWYDDDEKRMLIIRSTI